MEPFDRIGRVGRNADFRIGAGIPARTFNAIEGIRHIGQAVIANDVAIGVALKIAPLALLVLLARSEDHA